MSQGPLPEPPRAVKSSFVEDYLHGDHSAVGVVDDWIDVVLRHNYRFLRKDWADLRQEIRVRVIGNLSRGRFRGHSALHTYVYRIAKNVCIDFIRSARRAREQDDKLKKELQGPETYRTVEESGWLARDMLTKIMARLSKRERFLIRLVFIEHCSYEEVARRLNASETSIKSRVFRCRQRVLRMHEELLADNGNHDAS